MAGLALMSAVLLLAGARGKPALTSQPVEGGCLDVDSETNVYRMEGEAVILHFPILMSIIAYRKMAAQTEMFLISKRNGTEEETFRGGGRVQQREKQLWLLPAQTSDSGEYTCTYRSESGCLRGTVRLRVFDPSSVDLRKLVVNWPVSVGEEVSFTCPHLGCFNASAAPVDWFKDSAGAALPLGGGGGAPYGDGGALVIPAARPPHAGVYTCRLTVMVDGRPYRVSRAYMLHVEGADPEITTTTTTGHPGAPRTTDPGLVSRTSSTTTVPVNRPPVIVSPLNGTVFESSHGSGVELSCRVLTECPVAESTVVRWLVNGQSVESSPLDKRALEGGRRVTVGAEGCWIELRLAVVEITGGDERAEVSCSARNGAGTREVFVRLQLEDATLTWMAVAAVAGCCLVGVVSIFLCVLFGPRRKTKMDYFLARQNSSVSF
ncbi:interleukin-1 receptor type 2-like [Menidia menidia]